MRGGDALTEDMLREGVCDDVREGCDKTGVETNAPTGVEGNGNIGRTVVVEGVM